VSETFEGRTYIRRMTDKRVCSVCGAEEPTVLFEVTQFGDRVPVMLETRPFGITKCVNGPHLVDAPPPPARPEPPDPARYTEQPQPLPGGAPKRKWWMR
jgi:hypothetical protein